MTVSEVIQKEHFDVAIQKVLIGNSITSLKTIQRINFLEIFEKINGVEDVLKQDPSNVYQNMDWKTKEYYRNKIKEISEKTKISEIYIARKILEIAKICEENNISYNIYTEKNIITQDLKYNVLYYYKENLKKDANKITSIIKVDSILEYVKNEPNIKCLKITVCDENQTIFKSIVRRLRAIENIDVMDVSHMSRKVFKQGTEDIEIGYFYTEISSTQVNKWQAIKYLLPILQIKPEEVIGIGDNINDKEMIENAGLGVCMGQSTPVIKEISDEITDSNTEEGVANVLEKIFLQSN